MMDHEHFYLSGIIPDTNKKSTEQIPNTYAVTCSIEYTAACSHTSSTYTSDNGCTTSDTTDIANTGGTNTTGKVLSALEIRELMSTIGSFTSDNVDDRLISSQQFIRIGNTLGPYRCRMELLKYLEDWCERDERVAEILSRQIDTAGPNLIGGPQYATAYLPLLTSFAGFADQATRLQAVQAIRSVFAVATNLNELFDVATSISESDILFLKVSSCPILLMAIRRFAPLQNGAESSCVSNDTAAPTDLDDTTEINNKINKLIDYYLTLCVSQLGLIRRSANIHLSEFLDLLCGVRRMHHNSVDLYLQIISQFAVDDQEVVRLYTPNSALAFMKCKFVGIKERLNLFTSDLWPIINQLSEDRGWRVRCTTIPTFSEIIREVRRDLSSSEIALISGNSFNSMKELIGNKLLELHRDDEVEVRYAAVKESANILAEFIVTGGINTDDIKPCNHTTGNITDEDRCKRPISPFTNGVNTTELIMDTTGKMYMGDITECDFPFRLAATLRLLATNDKNVLVKLALVNSLYKICDQFNESESNSHFVEILLLLTSDENLEVRLEALTAAVSVPSIIENDKLSLASAARELLNEKPWRIRTRVYSQVVMVVVNQLHSDDFENSGFLEMFLSGTTDESYTTRCFCVSQLAYKMIQVYGLPWAEERLVPPLLELQKRGNYLLRIALTIFIGHMSRKLDLSESCNQRFASTIFTVSEQLCKDPIANIRLKAIKNIIKIISTDSTPPQLKTDGNDVLRVMADNDSDDEIRTFCQTELKVNSVDVST